jgi:hypothetical protein
MNQFIREIETDELCPAGKLSRAFLFALLGLLMKAPSALRNAHSFGGVGDRDSLFPTCIFRRPIVRRYANLVGRLEAKLHRAQSRAC